MLTLSTSADNARASILSRDAPSKSAPTLQLKSEKLGLVLILGLGLSGFAGALEEVLSRVRSKPGDDISGRLLNAS